MNVQVPLLTVVLLLAGGATLYLLYRAGRALADAGSAVADLKASNDQMVESLGDVAAALALTNDSVKELQKSLAPAAAALQANLAGIPILLENVAKVGQAQLELLQRQRAEAVEKAKSPFGRPNAPQAPRSTEGANAEYEIQQRMRAQGIGREQAMLEMNPANESSVWDGISTAGWGQ
jgi:hypothetical protein